MEKQDRQMYIYAAATTGTQNCCGGGVGTQMAMFQLPHTYRRYALVHSAASNKLRKERERAEELAPTLQKAITGL